MVSIDRTADHARTRLLVRRYELQRRAQRVWWDLARRHQRLSADSSRAIQLENDEPLAEIGSVAVQELQEIDDALGRIANGLYGICKRCSGDISASRLAAVPHAVTCATYEKVIEA